ncbi:hypothetical protein [Crossiella cryophila]|uniref:Uncharacterized protein n=1 Tax=Crossiella cryophila TaxID=43355 RepID=A0A7W7FWV4_9PSEU|nr:hypothetical protein [Crossiella cryophila]MBB4679988.1 hypothetical protein [Crossiella cryophila]
MRSTSLSRRALIAFAAATVVTSLLAPTAAAGAECTWQVEKLPVQDGMDWSNLRLTGVDAQGNVSGFFSPERKNHTLVRWTADGMEIVPRPEGVDAFVTIAGNASGVVIGRVYRPGAPTGSMTHTPGAGYRELPDPAGYEVLSVLDINDRGDVLGKAQLPGSPLQQAAVVWPADGGAPRVIAPAEVRYPEPVAIGEDGTVLLDSHDTAWLWRDGVLTKLPDQGSSVDPRALTRDGVIFRSPYSPRASWLWREATGALERFSVDGAVEAVNTDGLAAGVLDDGNYTAAVWQGTRFLAKLPLLPGSYESRLGAVGAGGVVAGTSGPQPVRWACR